MQVSQDERAAAFPGWGAQRQGTAPTRQATGALPRAAARSIEQARAARPVPQVRTEARLGTAAPPLATARPTPVMAVGADASVRQAEAWQQCLRSPAASAAGMRDLCGVAARRPGRAHRSAVVAHGCADLAAAPARADRVVRARFAERGYDYGVRSRSLGVGRGAHGIEPASAANTRGSSAGSIEAGLRALPAAARGRDELGGPVPGTALSVPFAIERLPRGSDAHRARSPSEQDDLPTASPKPMRATPPRCPANGRAWWRPA